MFKNKKIHTIVERIFFCAIVTILFVTLFISFYLNKSVENDKQENNIEKVHTLLSQLIIPSMQISDSSEMKKLLFMTSSNGQIFLIKDNDNIIYMSDYSEKQFSSFAINFFNSNLKCEKFNNIHTRIDGSDYLVHCSLLTPHNKLIVKNSELGILISFTKLGWINFSKHILLFVISLFIIFLLFIVLFRKVLSTQVINPLVSLKDRMLIAASTLDANFSTRNDLAAPVELVEIQNTFEKLLLSLNEAYSKRAESEKNSALLDLAGRVAHDIRSPLATMEISLKILEMNGLAEKTKMLKMAVQSVRDIANNLLDRYRADEGDIIPINAQYDDGQVIRPLLLASLIEQVVSQKRQEWLGKSCNLSLDVDTNMRAMWIEVSPTDVKRMCSNLLNNAFEACKNNAEIQIKISLNNGFIELEIKDNGAGVTSEKIISCLNGESTKHAGKGLGLSSANQYMKSINGTLKFDSKIDIGSSVRLSFPIANNPSWCPKVIQLSSKNIIVILDDDVSIQTFWIDRLQSYPIKIHTFSTYNETMIWVNKNRKDLNNMIFLVDYEFFNDDKNGLMLLSHVSVKSRGYLVSSHIEEVAIQKKANELNIWMISKSLISEIPIHFEECELLEP